MGETQNNPISLSDIKPSGSESPAMFHQEERSGRADWFLRRIQRLVLRDAHDTSRQEFGKRECVKASDLGVEELRIGTAVARGAPSRGADPKPLLQRTYRTGGGDQCDLLKPESP